MKKRSLAVWSLMFHSLLFCFIPARGQVPFQSHTVDPDFDGAASVFASDVNGDGYPDILSAAAYSGEIAWYESDGASPPQFSRHLVDDNIPGALFAHAARITDDTLVDILGASWEMDRIVLWTQDGAAQLTWNRQEIDTNFHGAHEVKAVDINGDTRMDVVAAAGEDHQIAWWHNGGGNPIVWTRYVISSSVYGARSVFPVDIDYDGDMDLVAAAFASDDVLLFINNGGEPVGWTQQLIDGSFDGAHWVHACDIDTDGDIDVLGAGYMASDVVIWYNDGASPAGWTEFVLDGGVPGALSVVVSDLDRDGLPDVVAAGDQAGKVIAWYQKDPLTREFTKAFVDQSISGAWPVYACDMDGDEDQDILAATSTLDDIRFYENLSQPAALDEPCGKRTGLRVEESFPNPFRSRTSVTFSLSRPSSVCVEMLAVHGLVIRNLYRGYRETGGYTVIWDGKDDNGNNVPAGTYLWRITTSRETGTVRILKRD